jgi:hypothetical protein
LASLGVVLRVAFWAITGRIWEDSLITLAHARNAVLGIGLTHHAGEPPTQGFTSALSVLIPLAGEVVRPDAGMVAIRLASLVAFVVAIVAADALGRRLGLERWPRLLVLGYIAVDANHVIYGMSGMETEVAVAVLLVSAWAVTVRSRWAGVALGVALLARPDFLIWAGIVVGLLMVRDRSLLGRMLAGAVAVVAPWLLFTTIYYGSPVPQTIVAKAVAFSSLPDDRSLTGWVEWVGTQVDAHVLAVGRTFAPFLEDTLSISAPIHPALLLLLSVTIVLVTLIGVADRWRDRNWTPIIAFVGAYLLYRILFLPAVYSDWYLPPFTAMTALLIAAGVQRLAVGRSHPAMVMAVAFVLAFAVPLPWVFGLERTIQTEIEGGVRVPASEALARMVAPDEGVASESAGYVGYGPGVLLLDSPGLTSRAALEVIRHLPPDSRTVVSLIEAMRPPWLVLRPAELGQFRALHPDTAAGYVEVQRFGTPRDEVDWNGYRKRTIDGEFIILQRSS